MPAVLSRPVPTRRPDMSETLTWMLNSIGCKHVLKSHKHLCDSCRDEFDERFPVASQELSAAEAATIDDDEFELRRLEVEALTEWQRNQHMAKGMGLSRERYIKAYMLKHRDD